MSAKRRDDNPRNAKMTPEQTKELQGELLPKIDMARQALAASGKNEAFSNMVAVAQKAGHSISTWQLWKGNAPSSPKFFDLRDFARAVGLDVKLLDPNAAVRAGALTDSRAKPLPGKVAELATLIAKISDPGIMNAVVARIREDLPTLIADETSRRMLAQKPTDTTT